MAKLKAKKQPKGKPLKRGFPWIWVTVALFIAAFVLIFAFGRSQGTVPPILKGTRAAIVDQLYSSYPNEDFTTEVKEELEGYGFEVDLYQGDAVTVDLYRKLPNYGYRLIILRAHSGAIAPNLEDPKAIIGTYLFTNEPYSKIKYPKEQLNDEMARSRVTETSRDLFVIGPRFITRSMKGNFGNAVVIIDGCSCLYNDDLAQAFTQKGASAYLAWDASVGHDYADEATTYLVKQLCKKDTTVSEAVMNTMAVIGTDPVYYAVLKYYPPQSGDKILEELIGAI